MIRIVHEGEYEFRAGEPCLLHKVCAERWFQQQQDEKKDTTCPLCVQLVIATEELSLPPSSGTNSNLWMATEEDDKEAADMLRRLQEDDELDSHLKVEQEARQEANDSDKVVQEQTNEECLPPDPYPEVVYYRGEMLQLQPYETPLPRDNYANYASPTTGTSDVGTVNIVSGPRRRIRRDVSYGNTMVRQEHIDDAEDVDQSAKRSWDLNFYPDGY